MARQASEAGLTNSDSGIDITPAPEQAAELQQELVAPSLS
jgi:hypothetical protein